MLVLTVIETVLLVVALVYIVALLRSHADILRRLTVLEQGGAGAGGRSPAAGTGAGGATSAPGGLTSAPGSGTSALGGGMPAPGSGGDRAAAPISGTTLAGDAVALSFGPGSPPTLLAFLSSGCQSCAPFWAGLREGAELGSPADRVVVVTHDAARESPSRVARLAPSRAEVVMSSDAWATYAVPSSPHFVLTDGHGGIRGRGSALSWSQLDAMIGEAGDDADALRGAAARTTEQRAARSGQALARAGIGPGHPSLFPTAAGQPPTGEGGRLPSGAGSVPGEGGSVPGEGGSVPGEAGSVPGEAGSVPGAVGQAVTEGG